MHAVPLAYARKLQTYASTHTQSKQKFQHLHTAGATTTAQQLFATAAGRPNSSNSSTQQRRRCGSGGDQLLPSEPPIIRLMTPCLGGCPLFGLSVVLCVVGRLCCVTCALYCWVFLAMIRTYVVMYVVCEWITLLFRTHDVLLRGFFTTTRKRVRR